MVSIRSLLEHAGRAPEVISASRQTPAWRPLLRYYLEIGRQDYPLHIPLRGGGALTLADWTEVKVFWNIFIHGAYRVPADCETILDCGANAGIFSVWAARQRPGAHIIALEPFPRTFAELEANIRQNHLEQRVKCLPVGLALREGDHFMSPAGDSPDRRLVPDDTPAGGGVISVRCTRLADCLRDSQLDELDLLKMDIEGSEWEVLLSTEPSVLRRIRHVQLEYHEMPARFGYAPDKLFAHLRTAGHHLTFRFEDAHHTGMAHFECLG
jgi:FkbM family methyltransferase